MSRSGLPDMDYITLDSFDANTAEKENLERLLSSLDNKACPAIPICIVGVKSSGKSFLLNSILRYLEAREKKSNDPFGSAEKPLVGFPWKKDRDPEKPSIRIWNKLFVSETSSSKVAILLIDTDGILDGSKLTFTAAHQIMLDFCLSISKLLIYNTPESFSSQQFENLKSAAIFHQFAHSGQDFTGNLTILVRDWNRPKKMPYGQEGGKEYLKYLVELPEGPSASTENLNQISRFYGDLNCFLMPFPGENVAGFEDEEGKDQSFDGSLKCLPSKYLGHLKSFVEEMLSTDRLHMLLEKRNYFTLDDIFSAFEATQGLYRYSFLQPYVQRYESQMKEIAAASITDDRRTVLHRHYQSDVVRSFELDMDGNLNLITVFEEELNNRLSQSLESCKRSTGDFKRKGRNDAVTTAKSEYTSFMEEKTANWAWHYPNDLKYFHESSLQRAERVLINYGYGDQDSIQELAESCTEDFKVYNKKNAINHIVSIGVKIATSLSVIFIAVCIFRRGSCCSTIAAKAWEMGVGIGNAFTNYIFPTNITNSESDQNNNL